MLRERFKRDDKSGRQTCTVYACEPHAILMRLTQGFSSKRVFPRIEVESAWTLKGTKSDYK
jgi:hypothetical protein